MDTTSTIENQPESQTPPTPQLTIDNTSKMFLTTTAKWAKFLGICGFIFTVLIVIMALVMGLFMTQIPKMEGMEGMSTIFGGGFTFIYLLMGALYFFPSLYVFNYGNKLKLALENTDNTLLNEAFKNQKSLYLFMGILTAMMIGIYGFFFMIGGLFAVFA